MASPRSQLMFFLYHHHHGFRSSASRSCISIILTSPRHLSRSSRRYAKDGPGTRRAWSQPPESTKPSSPSRSRNQYYQQREEHQNQARALAEAQAKKENPHSSPIGVAPSPATTTDGNEHNGQSKSKSKNKSTSTWQMLISTIATLPLVLIITQFLVGGQIMTVTGPSMSPALSPDYTATGRRDRVWAKSCEGTSRGDIRKGNVIAFWLVLSSHPHYSSKLSPFLNTWITRSSMYFFTYNCISPLPSFLLYIVPSSFIIIYTHLQSTLSMIHLGP